MLTFELFEHGSKSKLKSEILLYYKVKKTLHVLNLPNGWNSVYHNLCKKIYQMDGIQLGKCACGHIFCINYDKLNSIHLVDLNLPNGWNSVYHNLCNGMESSKHSMVKSPYFFSTFIVDARSIVSQAYPNKLP